MSRQPPKAARASVGHPVDVASGVVFTAWHDLELPGQLPLIWRRFYSTANTELLTPLGRGWTTAFFMHLREQPDTLVLVDDEGSEIECPRLSDGARHIDPANELEFTYGGGYYRVYYWHHHEYWIFEPSPQSGVWRLAWIEDLPGNRTHVSYDAQGRFLGVQHPDGRRIVAKYTGATDPIASLSLVLGDEEVLIVRYQYDSSNRLTEVVDAAGKSLSYAYDDQGLLIAETNRLGGTFRFDYAHGPVCTYAGGDGDYMARHMVYDTDQLSTRVTDSLGQSTTYFLDEDGRVIREVDPVGAVIGREYDAAGQLVALQTPAGAIGLQRDDVGNITVIVDRLGRATEFAYNALHLPVRMQHPDGTARRWEYDDLGNLIRVTDEADAPWEYRRDAMGRLVTAITPNGHRTDIRYGLGGAWHELRDSEGWIRYDYDLLGNLRQVTDTRGVIEQRRYDAVGNPTAVVQADGAIYQFSYDADGNVIVEQDELGRQTVHEYSPYGDLLAVRQPDDSTVLFEYDTEGRMVGIRNERGERSTARYDATGNPVWQQFFDGRIERYRYDGLDNLIEIIRPDGSPIGQAFDPVGNLTRRTFPDGTTASFEYDLRDRVVLATSPGGIVTLEYDPVGRITRETQNEQEVLAEYDAEGNRIRQVHVNGLHGDLRFTYDLRRRLIRIAAREQVAMEFEYDPADLLVRRRARGALDEQLAYDARGRLTHQQVRVEDRIVVRRRYTYDAADDLIAVEDLARGRADFSYDEREQLATAHRSERARERYRYDTAGNALHGEARIGPGNRLLAQGDREYQYDVHGQPVTETGPEGTTALRYDTSGQLIAVRHPDGRETTYQYDAFGRRLAKRHGSDITHFVWAGHQLVAELASDGTALEHVLVQFEPLAQITNGKWYSVITNHLSMPLELISAEGGLAWRGLFDSWGRLEREEGSPASPFRLPGQYADRETGLHYNRFRYYDPASGRYRTPDPIGYAGGLNEYLYAPSPTGWEDPLGLNCGQAHFKVKVNTKKGKLSEWKAKRDAFNKARKNKNAKIPKEADYKKRIRPEADKEAAAARKKLNLGSGVDADHPGDVRATGLLGQQLEPRGSGVNRSFGSQVGRQSRKRAAGSRTPMADLVDENGNIIK